jgi:hypothetical protein
VPREKEKDTQLVYALNLLRGVAQATPPASTGAGTTPTTGTDSTTVPN